MLSYFTRSIVRVFNAVILLGILIGLGLFAFAIGTYNYDRSMTDLINKAKNTADLAAISLVEPVWNYDTEAVGGIVTAILLDPDVQGISVRKVDGEVVGEKNIESLANVKFDDLIKIKSNITNEATIKREGKPIAIVKIATSTKKVKAVIYYTTSLIALLSFGLLVTIAGFVFLLGKRIIKNPIDSLREGADQLASGNLAYAIDTGRNDELGKLAISFDVMRNAIRKKLLDLSVLNKTGEVMAGIHDQTKALETVIKVMSEQSNVERGSIYLMDSDKNLVLNAFYPELAGSDGAPRRFKLTEGIAGHVASTGKTLYLPDTSKAPNYIDFSPDERPKALLCVPMMDDQRVIGVMNFVGEVGKVRFTEEDEGFALTVARMAVVTTKNIQMLKVIEEQNRTLEERIQQRTFELRQKNNDITSMLQNMRQGIFTVTKDLLIHGEYSAFLAEIFESNAVAGRSVSGFLFDQSDIGGDILNQIDVTLEAMIGENTMNFQFNSHLLVTEYKKHFEGGREKILELEWNPVCDGDVIEKIMVTVRDVTAFRALQLETEKQKEQLEIVGQILAVSKDKFMEFIGSSKEFLDENEKLIREHEAKDQDVLATLFRNMHTIKGNARTYGLTYATDCVHEVESVYSRLRAESEFPWNQPELIEQLERVRTHISLYENTLKEKLSGFESQNSGIDSALLDNVGNAIDNINELSQINELKNSLQLIKQHVNAVRFKSMDDILSGSLVALPSIAKQLDKETPDVTVVDHSIRVSNEIVPMLRNVFMHIFRNSLDHGLENSEVRVMKRKPIKGKMNLDVNIRDDKLLFTFKDDGKGLDLANIQKKAIANGQISADEPVSDEQIAEFIFLSGLSTASAVTNVSGRGVGMDAVRKFLQKYRGDTYIQFTSENKENGLRPFELHIELPAKYGICFT